jgi:7,8-dihydropterin-6-yl-methyl-4-(beta-D-ribofuranosyl)aminobenzene 5'-phosphate synthase
VRVLVDNVTDSLSTVPQGVMHEWGHLNANGNLVLSGEALCCAAFGLSLVMTARLGNAHHVLLFDAGPEAYAVSRNGDRLKIAFADIGAIVLSHGDWDHAGGLVEAINAAPAGAPFPRCPEFSKTMSLCLARWVAGLASSGYGVRLR